MLYIVSGFQIAGFRHVIGCLWLSDNRVCVDVVRLFYSKLGQGGTAKYNDDRAIALALHKAIMKIWKSKEY